MAATYQIPGVYFQPQPRASETILARTDVAGFIGFEPRVRDGSTPSALIGNPPVGHSFQVDVAGFQLQIGSVRAAVPATVNLLLSSSAVAIPILVGESIAYAVAVAEKGGAFILITVAGAAAQSDAEVPPSDDDLKAAVTAALGAVRPWIRLADVVVRRDALAIWLTVHPRLPIARCDDWRDYLFAFGTPADDGTLLGPAVRAYFANGGRRCWVATLRRPNFLDQLELVRAAADMVGVAGSSELEATGLERLLLQDEVTIVDTPDLYALRVDHTTRVIKLPPPRREACFLPCDEIVVPGSATSTDRSPAWTPIFQSSPIYTGGPTNQVFETQKALLARCISQRWRVFLLLSVPLLPDGGTGPYVPPTAQDAQGWMGQFDRLVKTEGFADTLEMACAALYWPWVFYQEQVDTPTLQMPPGGYVAGIFARRDLARGPQVSPANETLDQVVGLSAAFGDDVHGQLYSPAPDPNGFDVPGIDVLRAFAGYGIQLWGARTLSTDTWLRYISVRRTLTAIEIQMKAALDLLMFEPNTPMLWLQITHIAFGVLMPLFEAGGLRGTRPEEAFYVRCDGTINPPESVEQGLLFIEVGVAVAAPAEFIVFRIGRREGVVEVLE